MDEQLMREILQLFKIDANKLSLEEINKFTDIMLRYYNRQAQRKHRAK